MISSMKQNTFSLVTESSYTALLVQGFIDGLIEEKQGRAWVKRTDGLFEDCVGAIYAIDLVIGSDSIKIKMIPANIISF